MVRLSSQDVPTAYAYELEAATIVQPEQVIVLMFAAHHCCVLTASSTYCDVDVSNMPWLRQTQVVAAVKRVVGSRVAA